MSDKNRVSLSKLLFMGVNSFKARRPGLWAVILAAYGAMLSLSALPVFADSDNARDSLNSTPAPSGPAPGSEGDTLTRVDARMALLVYKLLGPDGKLTGANTARGEQLFLQNCRACHGTDGRRLNFAHDYRKSPIYLGDRARNDMPTFWYFVNFGDDGRDMAAYIDELTLDELIDIAGYVQTLP